MKNYLKNKKLSYHFMKRPNNSEILRLMEIASKNFFKKLEVKKIKSKCLVGIDFNKKEYFLLDLDKKITNIVSKKNFKSLNYTILKTDPRLLYLILKGPRYAHWDNADIGSHITYERRPDRYDRAINYALNFFHC